MKLLFDQNLSPRLVNRLSDLYPDSNHVYPLGIDRVADKEVWEYARREGYLVVTKDADFSDLCMLLGFPPKVIWWLPRTMFTSSLMLYALDTLWA